uniref:Uncharacterized protein n=1 Tax=Oryza rufipogon TaxID=4529 RepID=A0A0E0NYC2_ORYRU
MKQQAAVEALVVDIAARVGGGSGSDGEVLVRDVVHDALFPVAAWFCFGERDVRDLQRVLREFELDVVVEGFGGSMLANLVHWWRLRRFVASGRWQAEVFLPLISQRRRTQHRGEHKFRPYVDSLLDLRVPVGDNAAAGEGKEEHRLSHCALTDDEMVGLVSEFLGSGTESARHGVRRVEHPSLPSGSVRVHFILGDIGRDGKAWIDPDEFRPDRFMASGEAEGVSLLPRPKERHGVRRVEHPSLPSGGVRVHFILGDIGRDGKAWIDPDEFRRDRFMASGEAEGVSLLPRPKEGVSLLPRPKEVRMMPFGAGRRYCPSMGLGVAHACLLVAALVREFEWAAAATSGVELMEGER